MKWTEQTSPHNYGESIDDCEAFLKTNCKSAYDLSLVAVYIGQLRRGTVDYTHVQLNRLRRAGLCT